MTDDLDSLSDLLAAEPEDAELIPEILPASARLAVKGMAVAFIELFSRASAITPEKAVIPGTEYALLEAVPAETGRSGYLRLTASDGEQAVSTVSDSFDVIMAGKVLLPPKKILEISKLVEKMSELRLEVLADEATLRAGRARWTVKTPYGEALNVIPDVSGLELVTLDSKIIREGLQRVLRAVAATAARPSLMQVQIKNQLATSCDGSRVLRQRLDGLPEDMELTIPRKVIEQLLSSLNKSFSETFQVGISDYNLVFRIDNDSIIAQRLLTGFPDVESIILSPAVRNSERLIVDRVELLETIKRVRVNSDPEFTAVYLKTVPAGKTSDGGQVWQLAVHAKDHRNNSAQETIEAQWSAKKAIEVCVNHKHLIDLLESSEEEFLPILLGENSAKEKTRLLVDDKETGFLGVVQQMHAY